jgi:hypothetical protein
VRATTCFGVNSFEQAPGIPRAHKAGNARLAAQNERGPKGKVIMRTFLFVMLGGLLLMASVLAAIRTDGSRSGIAEIGVGEIERSRG